MNHRVASLAALLAVMCFSVAASACPVCFQAQNDENRIAFILTTVFLSLLPFALVGGLILWVRRKSLQAETRVVAVQSEGTASSGTTRSPVR